MGPELVFTGPATHAVAGATIAPKVNGSAVPVWESFDVAEGERRRGGEDEQSQGRQEA